MPDPIQVEFVNRDEELARYRAMLDGQRTHRLLTVGADEGWGKTWLLHHMRLESQRRGWPVASLDLNHDQAEDEIKFLMELRGQMAGPALARMDEALQTHRSRYQVTLVKPEGAPSGGETISGSDVRIGGDVVGGDKVVVNFTGGEDPVERNALRRDLTQAFFSGLKALPPPTRAALLLDTYEAVKTETRQWLEDELFPALRADEITSLVVVAAGTTVPEFSAREWRLTVDATQLDAPLPEDSVREYWLNRRRLPEEHLNTVLAYARKASPLDISLFADTIESSLSAR